VVHTEKEADAAAERPVGLWHRVEVPNAFLRRTKHRCCLVLEPYQTLILFGGKGGVGEMSGEAVVGELAGAGPSSPSSGTGKHGSRSSDLSLGGDGSSPDARRSPGLERLLSSKDGVRQLHQQLADSVQRKRSSNAVTPQRRSSLDAVAAAALAAASASVEESGLAGISPPSLLLHHRRLVVVLRCRVTAFVVQSPPKDDPANVVPAQRVRPPSRGESTGLLMPRRPLGSPSAPVSPGRHRSMDALPVLGRSPPGPRGDLVQAAATPGNRSMTLLVSPPGLGALPPPAAAGDDDADEGAFTPRGEEAEPKHYPQAPPPGLHHAQTQPVFRLSHAPSNSLSTLSLGVRQSSISSPTSPRRASDVHLPLLKSHTAGQLPNAEHSPPVRASPGFDGRRRGSLGLSVCPIGFSDLPPCVAGSSRVKKKPDSVGRRQ
jgi:hypothetical protein